MQLYVFFSSKQVAQLAQFGTSQLQASHIDPEILKFCMYFVCLCGFPLGSSISKNMLLSPQCERACEYVCAWCAEMDWYLILFLSHVQCLWDRLCDPDWNKVLTIDYY